MAGFAVVMTILMYGFFGIVLAVAASLYLHFAAKRKRSQQSVHPNIVLESTLAPFAALLWLALALMLHVQVSNHLAHQDCGFSPDPYVTLPNGYVVGSANTYDGYVSAPGARTDIPISGPGYVRSLIDLRFDGNRFSGTQFVFKTSRVRSFTFDTKTQHFEASEPDYASGQNCESTDPKCLDQWAAMQTRVHTDADSYWQVYARYRHTWPNYVLTLLLLSGEGVIAFAIWRLWHTPNPGKIS